jgi:hypothetical protein
MPSSKYSRAHQALIVQRATPCARRSRLLSRSSGHCSAAGSLAFGFGGRCRSGASWSTSLLRLRDSSPRSMVAITLGVAPPMRAAIGRSLGSATACCGSQRRSCSRDRSMRSRKCMRRSTGTESHWARAHLPHRRGGALRAEHRSGGGRRAARRVGASRGRASSEAERAGFEPAASDGDFANLSVFLRIAGRSRACEFLGKERWRCRL